MGTCGGGDTRAFSKKIRLDEWWKILEEGRNLLQGKGKGGFRVLF